MQKQCNTFFIYNSSTLKKCPQFVLTDNTFTLMQQIQATENHLYVVQGRVVHNEI